jgi:predicted metal-binding membrane protein
MPEAAAGRAAARPVPFVFGMGNLGWMLLLALLMALEKNLPGGRRLSMPLGLLLLGWAAALVMVRL